jgi:hypothetical protein
MCDQLVEEIDDHSVELFRIEKLEKYENCAVRV